MTYRKAAVALLLPIIIAGCKARQLARPTPQMDIEPQFWVRVLLLDDVTNFTLKIASPFSIISYDPRASGVRNYFDRVNVPLRAEMSAGTITIAGQNLTSSEVIISPDPPYIFNLNGDDYRGKLKLQIGPDGTSFDAINLVPLEPYLAGVVGAEMPDYWEPAALRAQAVAARTYCLYIKKRFGSNRAWDVRKTQANQVYLGVRAESAQIWDAISRTYGRILVCKHPDGTEDIFPAYYSSICGGHTEDSKHVFGDSFEALVGRTCRYCKEVAKRRFFYWPTVQFDKTDVTARLLQRYPKLKQLGEITNIRAAKQRDYQGNYGKFSRLTLVKLIGSSGKSDFLRAEDFRLTIDPSGKKIKSTICQIINEGDKWAFISGRGYGHGVGMCQCGTQAMAREGKTANQILSYYYYGSKIVRVY
ncbi:MAG: SpoIID/LytB domain-containing protein [Planctomycetota bacterium]